MPYCQKRQVHGSKFGRWGWKVGFHAVLVDSKPFINIIGILTRILDFKIHFFHTYSIFYFVSFLAIKYRFDNRYYLAVKRVPSAAAPIFGFRNRNFAARLARAKCILI
jgi:hypothetical protein